jgi:hypothetical protein
MGIIEIVAIILLVMWLGGFRAQYWRKSYSHFTNTGDSGIFITVY